MSWPTAVLGLLLYCPALLDLVPAVPAFHRGSLVAVFPQFDTAAAVVSYLLHVQPLQAAAESSRSSVVPAPLLDSKLCDA